MHRVNVFTVTTALDPDDPRARPGAARARK